MNASNWFYIFLGVPIIMLGISMIILHWCPNMKLTIEKLTTKYNVDINEKRLCNLEGIRIILLGLTSVVIGIFCEGEFLCLTLLVIMISIFSIIFSYFKKKFLSGN